MNMFDSFDDFDKWPQSDERCSDEDYPFDDDNFEDDDVVGGVLPEYSTSFDDIGW